MSVQNVFMALGIKKVLINIKKCNIMIIESKEKRLMKNVY